MPKRRSKARARVQGSWLLGSWLQGSWLQGSWLQGSWLQGSAVGRFSRGRSPAGRWAAGIAMLITSWLVLIPNAEAYCLTSACAGDFPGQRCIPARPDDCGTPLAWSTACFGVAVQQDASSQIGLETAESLVAQAFAAWENASCANGNPAISVSLFDTVTCDQQEYNQRGGNINAVIFRDAAWPYAGAANTLALTTVTYNLDTGEIFDADLEVNSTSAIELTTTDTGAVYDMLSILTHEAGHMLGVAHSAVSGATMQVEYQPGDLELRSLHPDDEEAICDLYPGPDLGTCDATPRHGLKETCGPGPGEEEACRVAGSGPADASWMWGSLLALMLIRPRRRRSVVGGR